MKTFNNRILGALTAMCALLAVPACDDGGDERALATGDDAADGDETGAADPDQDEAEDGEQDAGEAEDGGVDAGEADEGGMDEGGMDEGGMDEGGAQEGGADEGGADEGGEETGGEDTGGEDTGEETGGLEPLEAEEDFDFQANPGLWVQFRATAGPATTVDGPLFNADPLDVRGIQWNGEVSNPGDAEDWLEFRIVPGQNDPTIAITLLCDNPGASPQPLRASLHSESGQVLDTFVCGDATQNVTLDNASSLDAYFVRIYQLEGSVNYAEYSLQIDAFCPGVCEY